MSSFILDTGATVTCAHGGMATPTAPMPRVKLLGNAVATIGAPYTIAGCTASPPCVIGQWNPGALHVRVGGQAVVLNTNSSVCTPNGTPMQPSFFQQRISAI